MVKLFYDKYCFKKTFLKLLNIKIFNINKSLI